MKKGWHQQFKRKPKADRTWNDIVFDSALEMRVYLDLLEMEKRGEVKNVQRQVRHELRLPDGTFVQTARGKVSIYTTDLEWDDVKTGEHRIADVKGYVDEHSAFRIRVFEALSKCKVIFIRK